MSCRCLATRGVRVGSADQIRLLTRKIQSLFRKLDRRSTIVQGGVACRFDQHHLGHRLFSIGVANHLNRAIVELIRQGQLSLKAGDLSLPIQGGFGVAVRVRPIQLLLHHCAITLHKSKLIKAGVHVRALRLQLFSLTQNILRVVKSIEFDIRDANVNVRTSVFRVQTNCLVTFLDRAFKWTDGRIFIGQ